MLSLDKRGHVGQSNRDGQRQQTKNFLALNKMSVCRRRTAIRQTDKELGRGRNPAGSLSQSNGGFPQQQQRRQGEREQKITGKNLEREETVTISKNYLEQLLRESFMQDKLGLASHSTAERTGQQGVNDAADPQKHLDLNPSDIPGLGVDQRKEPHSHSIPHQKSQDSVASQLAIRDQWLLDLAVQVEENKRHRERQKLEREHLPEKESFLFPFGDLGARTSVRNEAERKTTGYSGRGQLPQSGQSQTMKSSSYVQDRPSQLLENTYPSGQLADRGHVSASDWHEPVAIDGVPERGTYHRGTSNRPTHPSMRSNVANIVFGGGGKEMMERLPNEDRREISRKQWLEELTDQIEHKKVAMDISLSVAAHQPTGRQAPSSTNPKFARGAGPHVDDYMRMEMDVKKRKEIEHRECLLAQIAEKKKKKEQERLQKEREEREEEEHFMREKQRAAREFEKEKERQKAKEEEAAKKLLLIQRRTQLAAESALQAKEEARLSKLQRSPTRKPRAVIAEDGGELHKSPAVAVHGKDYTEVSIHVPKYSNQQILDHDDPHQMASIPATFLDSHLRTPSLFQAGGGPPSPQEQLTILDGRNKKHTTKVKKLVHTTGSRSSLHSTSSDEAVSFGKRRREGRMKTTARRSGGNRVSGMSLIPVPTKRTAKRLVNWNDQGSDSESANPRHPSEQRRQGQRPLKAPVANSVIRRSKNNMADRDHHKRLIQNSRIPPNNSIRGRVHAALHGSSTEEEASHMHFTPPRSPPVPAVARRLAMREKARLEESNHTDHLHSQPAVVPALDQRLAHYKHPQNVPQETASLPARIHSPPVPAVARRLTYSQQMVDVDPDTIASHGDSTVPEPALANSRVPVLTAPTTNEPNNSTTSFMTSSPYMPATRGHQKDSLSLKFQEHSSQPVLEMMQFPVFSSSQQVMGRAPGSPLLLASSIERSASISPINQPLSLPTINGLSPSSGGGAYSLPPIHEIRSADEGKTFLSSGASFNSLGMAPRRQQQILEQLSRLKHAILSKQRDMDHRASAITSRYKRLL